MVNRREFFRKTCNDDVVARINEATEGERQGRLFLQYDRDGGQYPGPLFVGSLGSNDNLSGCLFLWPDVCDQGLIPLLWRNCTVADDVSTTLGDETQIYE